MLRRYELGIGLEARQNLNIFLSVNLGIMYYVLQAQKNRLINKK